MRFGIRHVCEAPYNGGGVFSPPGASFPAVSNTLIEASKFNAVINDIATNGLSNVITKDGQTTVTANIPFATFRITGLGAAAARTDAIQYAQVQDGSPTYLTSPAGTNTITATAPFSMAAYAAGQKFVFIPAGTNTGATTLNINSIGAKNIYAGHSALVGGELHANIPVTVFYDGTQFQLLGPVFKQPTRTTLTSGTAATYNTPTGATRIRVRAVGGGGGGGGGANATYFTGGGGGGSGGYVEKTFTAPSSTYTYTVGGTAAGGAAGSPGATATAGNNTTFGTLTASGGAAGTGGSAAGTGGSGAAGGAAAGGDVNIPGSAGGGGAPGVSGVVGGPGGPGGASQLGGNGGGAVNGSGNINAGTNSGSGGGGGSNSAGGTGAAGIIIVEEFYD